ncbi:MAG: helix-turn-helix domain-containing protein [Clostridia bacterium]|jgi:excisionase family DNA binding protein|nr:helix-turn-helix domain-containing protein [Clostridia bacterium]
MDDRSRDENGEPLVLTVAEVARLLRVGQSTLRQALKRGDIPHVRLGRRILIRRDALFAWMEEREHSDVITTG